MAIIKNYKGLIKTKDGKLIKIRENALRVVEAGLKAIQIEKIIKENIYCKGDFLTFQTPSLKEKIDLKKFKKIFVVGFGKGSARAVLTIEEILKEKIEKGIIIDVSLPRGVKKSKIEFFKGSHPLPSSENIRATKKVISLLQKASSKDLVIVVIFGGGSALLTAPVVDISLFKKINKDLLRSGKSIYEVDTIRKHLDKIKGGNLAKFIYPAQAYTLICSDVPGDDISIIASGPTVKDKTTKEDAKKIAQEFDWPKNIFMETPKDEKFFERIKNSIFISNKIAIEAMKREAKKIGFEKIKIYSRKIQGEARIIGNKLFRNCQKKEIILAGGETTVTVRGKGKGGRNQELVLGVLDKIKKDELVISIDTDGKDNSEAAGAIGDIYTKNKAQELGLNRNSSLEENNSFYFFKKVNGLIFLRKGVNIADLIVIIR